MLDCFHGLYHRSQYSDVEVEALICPLMTTEGISLFRRSYEASRVHAEDIDEAQYLYLKKLAEVCALMPDLLQILTLSRSCVLSQAFSNSGQLL